MERRERVGKVRQAAREPPVATAAIASSRDVMVALGEMAETVVPVLVARAAIPLQCSTQARLRQTRAQPSLQDPLGREASVGFRLRMTDLMVSKAIF